MAKKPWLVLDCNYLAYRAFHTFTNLSHDEVGTGVVFGFLRDIITLTDIHNTHKFVFCFDYGPGYRKEVYPEYKANRKTSRTDPEVFEEVRRQVKLLRTKYLPKIGYGNIVADYGYEADDMIARITKHVLDKDERAIIVSSDHDMYQLLEGTRIIIWNPRTQSAYNEKKLMEEFGVTPKQWIDVKAIAGCKSDNIKGVGGVGEKTAAKFVSGQLKPGVAYDKIRHNFAIRDKNEKLVRLPFDNVGNPFNTRIGIAPERPDSSKWDALCRRLGISSLIGHCPE